jgi:hypothetical protein
MGIAHFDRQGSPGMVFPFVVARIGAEWRIKFPRLSRVFCGIPLPLATPVLTIDMCIYITNSTRDSDSM